MAKPDCNFRRSANPGLRAPTAPQRVVLRRHEVLEAECLPVHRTVFLEAVEARVREQALPQVVHREQEGRHADAAVARGIEHQ